MIFPSMGLQFCLPIPASRPAEFDKILGEQHRSGTSPRNETPALLRGVIKCGTCDCSMGPTFTSKNGRRHVYYLCVQASKRGYASCPVRSVSAATIEAAVVSPTKLART